MARKTSELPSCKTCENHQFHNDGKEYCKAEPKMTFNEYEDYFIDQVKKCPYYKKGEPS